MKSGTEKSMEDRTREILGKVREVEIRTRRLVTDALTGQYHSVFKGQGMNFEEVREYSPGDEVRTIDWNVTARTGRPFVKKYSEERELTVLLMVDVSASGHFGSGTQSKRELAAELASVLAFSAMRNNDKVGLILFSDGIEHFSVPKKGRAHILRIIREILFFQPKSRKTDISGALDFANRVIRHRCVAFLISDFQAPDARLALQLTHRRHDLVGVYIHDPRELEIPAVGCLTLEDSETGEQLELDTTHPSVRARFFESAGRQRRQVQKQLRSLGIDLLELSTGDSYMPELRRFFITRERRRR